MNEQQHCCLKNTCFSQCDHEGFLNLTRETAPRYLMPTQKTMWAKEITASTNCFFHSFRTFI